MQIYVWRGRKVLERYGTGLVVIAAVSAEDAWNRLAQHDASAYWQLRTSRELSGAYRVSIDSPDARWPMQFDQEENGGLDKPDPGFPIEPEAYSLENLPVLLQWGTE